MNMMVKPEKRTVTIFDVATVKKGSQLSKTDIVPGPYPVMNGRTEPVGFHVEANRAGGAIAMTEGGECGRVTLMSEPYWSGGHSYDIRPQECIDLEYLYYALLHNERNFAAASKGVAIKNLSLGSLKEVRFHIHGGNEQRFIATTLSTVDAKLSALREKADGLRHFKTGLMQRLFSQELRFTREDGSDFPDWEEQTLGNFGELYGGLSGKSGEDFGEGSSFITYRQVFQSARIDVSKFALVKIGPKEKQNRVVFGDVLMTTSSETPSEVGFASVMLDEVEDLYLNSFCFGYRPYDLKALLPEFSKYLFRSPLYRREVIKLAQGSTRFNISRTGFLKIKLLFPDPEEQEKIASALSALDTKIAAVTDEITHMETFKKGLLQKIFA